MRTELQFIPLLVPADYQAGAQDFDSVNMGKLQRLSIAILLGAITGNDPVIKLYGGATAGAKTTEMAFKYRKSSADSPAASADVLGARTSIAAGGTGLTFTSSASFDLRMLRIDVESSEMPEGLPWLTVETDDGSASVLLMSAIGVGEPRFQGDTLTTAL